MLKRLGCERIRQSVAHDGGNLTKCFVLVILRKYLVFFEKISRKRLLRFPHNVEMRECVYTERGKKAVLLVFGSETDPCLYCTESEFLDVYGPKVFRVFLLAIRF